MKKVRTCVLEEDIFRDGRLVLEWWLGKRPNRWLLPGDYKVVGQTGAVVEVEVDVPEGMSDMDPLEAAWIYLHNLYGGRS